MNITHGCTAERRGIGGRRPEGRCQSEKSAGEQASLGLGSWNSGQGHVKGLRSPVARRPRWAWDARLIGGTARLCSLYPLSFYPHGEIHRPFSIYMKGSLPCSRSYQRSSSVRSGSSWEDAAAPSSRRLLPADSCRELPVLKFVHLLRLTLMGAGLIGVWYGDRRSRQAPELSAFAEGLHSIAVLYDGLVVPGALLLVGSGT